MGSRASLRLATSRSHSGLAQDWWFWLGAAAAALIALPNVLWQAANGWPTLEFIRNAQQWKNAPLSPGAFLSAQVLFQQPLAAPLWVLGILVLLFASGFRRHRFLGVAYLLLLLLFVLQRGRPYYLSPIYPGLLAAGAVWLERILERGQLRWPARAYAALLATGGLVTLPIGLPVLPPETYLRYSEFLGMTCPGNGAGARHPPVSFDVEVAENPKEFKGRAGHDLLSCGNALFLKSLKQALILKSANKKKGLDLTDSEAVDLFISEFKLPRLPGERKAKVRKLKTVRMEEIAALGEKDRAELDRLLAKAKTEAQKIAARSVAADQETPDK